MLSVVILVLSVVLPAALAVFVPVCVVAAVAVLAGLLAVALVVVAVVFFVALAVALDVGALALITVALVTRPSPIASVDSAQEQPQHEHNHIPRRKALAPVKHRKQL